MILSSSQNIHSSHPLGTISSRRVNGLNKPAPVDGDEKKVEEEQKRQDETVLRQLRARDREVRAHEAAHVAAGGSLVRGGPSFTLQRGPDGRSYAIGGEVQLDTSAVPNDPEATLRKSDQVRAAALAPAQPSPQDLRVAANANQLAARARIDIAIQRREEAQLEEQQGSPDEVENTDSEPQSGDSASSAGSLPENQRTTDAVTSDSRQNRLQAQEQPVAAISNFMSTAQSESRPARFNQFA